jgi:hypothetical protein
MADDDGSGASADAEAALLRARAMVLHDLAARGADGADAVDLVEDVVSGRRWWVREWPEGAGYVAGQVAQDVQDRLMETEGRWPTCGQHREEPLQVSPALGAEPWWVCERGCGQVAPLGALPAAP